MKSFVSFTEIVLGLLNSFLRNEKALICDIFVFVHLIYLECYVILLNNILILANLSVLTKQVLLKK